MAAYAALTSLKNIILNLQIHPSPPMTIDKQQLQSLTKIVTFLQEFLRGYISNYAYSEEADPLEARIADAAYKAEDVIESRIVDRIRSDSTGDDLYEDLQLVIEEMELIREAAMAVQSDIAAVRPQLQRNVPTDLRSSASSSSTYFSNEKNNTMVGFDDVFLEMLDRLTGSQLDLQIIPITGMGGIGKTTLARNIFENARVKEHFDICSWTTISQDYNVRLALKELLSQARGCYSSDVSESELGIQLYQYLWGRRYLIVLDDMWNIEVWDKIRRYFPNNKDGSRVIVTSRQSNLTSHLNSYFNMKFLDELNSWNLFTKVVFGEKSFPLELEDIGKNIARKCRGLPLSIVTIGGLLSKSEQTREYWVQVEGNLNSIVNSEDDEYCLRILKMSYNHLPVHLKPCFLYMGVFEEDCEIRVSRLVKLWVSEGFLEPTREKSLETMAKENLENLVNRNLVQVHKLGSRGDMKYCKIHDLLRDLCLREAEKERFYGVVWQHIPQGINSLRRIVIRNRTSKEMVLKTLESMLYARSVLCGYLEDSGIEEMPRNLSLLRTLESYRDYYFQKYMFELVNLRCLHVDVGKLSNFTFPVNLFWNLHTLVCDYQQFNAPIEIWNMPHLRHVKSMEMHFPDPPTDHFVIMENLQTLKRVRNFKLNYEIVRRIPNIKKLHIKYYDDKIMSTEDYSCLKTVCNLERLDKLESFECSNYGWEFEEHLKMITFPQSLKKLVLYNFDFGGLQQKIGSLPVLQELRLSGGFFRTGEWETVEGKFRKLEILEVKSCHNLKQWTSDSSHFPLLKKIRLQYLNALEEIPSGIGDIATLQAIELRNCNRLAIMSLKKIVEEQEELQGEEQLPFRVEVFPKDENKEEALKLAGPNFEVTDEWPPLEYW